MFDTNFGQHVDFFIVFYTAVSFKFVKLFTQNFPYHSASFTFSFFCVHPVFVTKGKFYYFFCRVKYIQNKKNIFVRRIFFN